jgi:uncharacterized protein (DUF342 family)
MDETKGNEQPAPALYPTLAFEFDPESKLLFALVGRAAVEQPLDEAAVMALLEKQNFHVLYREPDAIAALLKTASTFEEARVEFARQLDATVTLEVSEDRMQAFVSTTPAYGGASLTYDNVVAAMEGVQLAPRFRDEKRIAELLDGPPVTKQLFAAGISNTSGKDGRLVFLVSEIIRKTPTEDARGVVDMHDRNEFVIVEPGAPLMRRIPPTPGADGCDVLGNPVPAEPARDYKLSPDSGGTMLDPDDENQLIAAIKGHPLVFRDAVKVDPVLHLQDVNLKTGNINFDGTVNIAGDVVAGMVINAGGDVIVSGVVEKATIIAGHNIVVGGGVIGGELGREEKKKLETAGMDSAEKVRMFCKGHIKAGGSISAKYISMTDVVAGQDVVVNEYILNSAVSAKGEVLLGQKGGKGYLIGGYCHAPGGVKANVLGNDVYVKTHVTVGHPKELDERFVALHELIEKKKAILIKLQEGMLKLEKSLGPDSAGHVVHQQIAKILQAITQLHVEIDDASAEYAAVHAEIQKTEGVRVSARAKTYANVYLCINGVEKRVEEETAGGSFVANFRKIKFEK